MLVLGLGNVLCGDDGLGVSAVERVRHDFTPPKDTWLLDGGTLGLWLLPYFEHAGEVVLLDAVRADAPPGTLVRLRGEEVAPAVRERLSVHQIGVADLLESARLLGHYPRTLLLLGLVPADLSLRVGLSPPVAAALPELVAATVRAAASLGQPFTPRHPHDPSPTPSHDAPHHGAGRV